MPSAQIVVLTAATLGAVAYAFVCQLRAERAARSTRAWLLQNRPGLWEKLPWLYRKLAYPRIGLDVLRRRGLREDEDFLQLWTRITRWEKRGVASVVIGLACAGLAIAGSKIWGWQW